MNRIQIICLLVTLALVFGVVYVRHSRDQLNYVGGTSYQIGTDLIAQTNSAWLTQLEPGFRTTLYEFLRFPTSIASFMWGDEPAPFGDGKAKSRLVLTNTTGQTLTIRFRPDPKSSRFQILSYWTAQP